MHKDAVNDGRSGSNRWHEERRSKSNFLKSLLDLTAIIAIACLAATLPIATANPDAKRLYDDLLSNYNRLIRPVGNNSDRLTVKLGLRLSQLIDVVSVFFFFLGCHYQNII